MRVNQIPEHGETDDQAHHPEELSHVVSPVGHVSDVLTWDLRAHAGAGPDSYARTEESIPSTVRRRIHELRLFLHPFWLRRRAHLVLEAGYRRIEPADDPW